MKIPFQNLLDVNAKSSMVMGQNRIWGYLPLAERFKINGGGGGMAGT